MKKLELSVAVKATPKKNATTKRKRNTGYVPCLPEYEGDVSHIFDFSKNLTMEEVFEMGRKKQKKQKAA